MSSSGDSGPRTTDAETAAYVVEGRAPTAFSAMAVPGGGWAPPSIPVNEDQALTLDTTRQQHVSIPGPYSVEVEDVAKTLKSRTGNGKTGVGLRTTDADQSFVVQRPASEEAATLTSGGDQGEGVSPPGRRSEDDDNLVAVGDAGRSEPASALGGDADAAPGSTMPASPTAVEEPTTFDWQLSGGGNDKSFRGHSRTWIEDKPGTARALTSNKTLAVHIPDVSPALSSGRGHRLDTEQPNVVAFQQTPQGDLLEDAEGVSPPLLGREAKGVGNNSPLIAEPQAFNWEGDDPGNTPAGETPPLGAGHAGSIAVGFIAGSSPATGGVGAEDEIAPTLGSQDNGSTRVPTVARAYTKTHGAIDTEDAELWDEAAEARTLNGMGYATDVVVESFETRVGRNGRGAPTAEVAPLKATSGSSGTGDGAPMVMAVSENQRREFRESEHAPSLGEPSGHMGQGLPSVRTGAAVRRLTPRECERLQGLPDDWTLLEEPMYDDEGKLVKLGTPDGPRYAAIGDCVTVNVPYWIASRLVRRERGGAE